MEEIKKAEVMAPISVGEVLLYDVAGTGVNVIATGEIRKGKLQHEKVYDGIGSGDYKFPLHFI